MSIASFPMSPLRHIALPFALGAVAVILIILKIGLASATITITPTPQSISGSTEIQTIAATSTADALSARLYSARAETAERITSGSVRMEKGRSKGEVTILNNSSASQTLVATTRLFTPTNILFRLDNRAVVPAGSSRQVQVTADQEGPSSDVKPTTFTIPGLSPDKQKLIFAESKTPMQGGLKEISLITQKDIDASRQKTRAKLESQLHGVLQRQVSLPYYLPAGAIAFTERSFTTTAKADTTAENASLTLTLEAVGVALKEEDLVSALRKNMMSTQKNGLRAADSDNLQATEINLISYNLDHATSTLSVTYSYTSLPDLAGNKDWLSPVYGKKKKDAEDYLKNTLNTDAVSVKLSPFWVTKIPRSAQKINLVIEQTGLTFPISPLY